MAHEHIKPSPYNFLDSESNVYKLTVLLDNTGLNFVSKRSSYKLEQWQLQCKWKQEDQISIKWNKHFWDDGMLEEDDNIEFIVNDISIGKIDVFSLLEQRYDIDLDSILLSGLEKLASLYSGKKFNYRKKYKQ